MTPKHWQRADKFMTVLWHASAAMACVNGLVNGITWMAAGCPIDTLLVALSIPACLICFLIAGWIACRL